jgi:hypothetical protein
LPTPWTPCTRIRGGFSAVLRFREASEMAISWLPLLGG